MTGTYRKRPPFHYFEMGFQWGDKLYFKPNPSIVVEIASDRTVLYRGEDAYITILTARLRHVSSSCAGKYWQTESGRSLLDIYEETYPIEEYR